MSPVDCIHNQAMKIQEVFLFKVSTETTVIDSKDVRSSSSCGLT